MRIIMLIVALAALACGKKDKDTPQPIPDLQGEIDRQNQNNALPVEPPPAEDNVTTNEEAELVKSLKLKVLNEDLSSQERADAIRELIPYKDYASVVTMMVELARGKKAKEEAFDKTKGTTDTYLIAGLGEYFSETKFSSPSIVESEIAMYHKIKDLDFMVPDRKVIVESLSNKTKQDWNLLRSVAYQDALMDMVKHEEGQTQIAAVEGFAIKEAAFWAAAEGAHHLGQSSRSLLSKLLYIASTGYVVCEFPSVDEYLPECRTTDNAVGHYIGEGAAVASYAVVNFAFESIEAGKNAYGDLHNTTVYQKTGQGLYQSLVFVKEKSKDISAIIANNSKYLLDKWGSFFQ